jgi:hypothetical protein
MIDYGSLTWDDQVAQLVLLCKGKGLVLPYDDYRVIRGWVEKLKDPHQLESFLGFLGEELPPFYGKFPQGSLKGLDKKIHRYLNYQ